MLTAQTPPPPAPPPACIMGHPVTFTWECDGCERKQVTATFALPQDWVLLPAPVPEQRKILCPDCGHHFSLDGDL